MWELSTDISLAGKGLCELDAVGLDLSDEGGGQVHGRAIGASKDVSPQELPELARSHEHRQVGILEVMTRRNGSEA